MDELLGNVIFGNPLKKNKGKKKKKKKKKVIQAGEVNNDSLEILECEIEELELRCESNSEDNLSDNVSDDLSEDHATNISDNNLHLDGIMKTAPQYPKECEQQGETSYSPEVIIGTPPIFGNNLRALDKYAVTYELEKFDKNYLMIFNQENIVNYEPRKGTEKDVKALEKTFLKYKFEFVVHNDLTKDEIMEKLKIFHNKDFTDYGCVAVVVLTHGNKNGLIRAKDREYSETEIINFFKTHDKPTLITKPKILIIQACRGARLLPAVPVMRAARIRMDHDMEVEPYTLPVESDMLILHSSYLGSPSLRCEVNGSWLIQTLCKKIDEHAHDLDLESILTEVKRAVSIELQYDQLNRVTYEIDSYKQMPVVTSTLIRKLYLKLLTDHTEPVDDGDEPISPPIIREDGQHLELDVSIPLGQCQCILNYFLYIKDILSDFLIQNPEDKIGQSYLAISNTFKDISDFNLPKQEMCKLICEHLLKNARDHEYYKYLYLNNNL